MPDEKKRKYLFVAIDRATRWVFLEILPDKSAKSARTFLQHVVKQAALRIKKLLTDNGKEFTDRLFTENKKRKPTGKHLFDQECARHGITHRLTKPRHPQTNGMIEHFNGRISEIVKTTKFFSSTDLKQTLYRYRQTYNHNIPQRALGLLTPVQALKAWRTEKPALFKKNVRDLSGLDTSFRNPVAKTLGMTVNSSASG